MPFSSFKDVSEKEEKVLGILSIASGILLILTVRWTEGFAIFGPFLIVGGMAMIGALR